MLRTGARAAIVIDAGPDPATMDHCLDRLHIDEIPLFIATHYDADHVNGTSGAFDGRHVGAIWTTVLNLPQHGVDEVDDAAHSAGVTPVVAPFGQTVSLGPVTLQVLWPDPARVNASTSNDGSIVVLATTDYLPSRPVTVMLTGDIDPEGQAAIAAEIPGRTVDVLKIPHHGSKYQDEDWLLSLHPVVAIASVGIDNDYGHPAPEALDPLLAEGVNVFRTDHDGGIAVLATAQGLAVATQK